MGGQKKLSCICAYAGSSDRAYFFFSNLMRSTIAVSARAAMPYVHLPILKSIPLGLR